MIKEKMLDELKNFNNIALAVSGGKDSMSLLHFFIDNRTALNDFYVVNVNHNLRGEESARDSRFVKDYCDKNGVKFVNYDEDIKSFCERGGYGIEQGARLRRRQIFDEIVASKKADRVATAHHKDDQVESILMHIFRGSGINGLCGMSFDDGVLLRPLLKLSRQDIDEYIEVNKIPWVQDSTNLSNDYCRNRIRNTIVPEITKSYGGANDNICRLAEIASQYRDYVDGLCEIDMREDGSVAMPCRILSKNDIVSRQTVVRGISALTSIVDITNAHIEQVLDISAKTNGARTDLPYGLSAYKENSDVVLAMRKQKSASEMPFDSNGFEFEGQKVEITLEKEFNFGKVLKPGKDINGNKIFLCDYDKIKNCTIRTRRQGDSFVKFGGGRKSLGDYFTDIKVPSRMRDNVLLLVDGNEILAVLPYEISQKIAITKETSTLCWLKIVKRLQ